MGWWRAHLAVSLRCCSGRSPKLCWNWRPIRLIWAALKEARSSGRLAGEAGLGETNWGALMVALYRHEWLVYAKQPMGGPAQVLDYLARYTHKVAISNHRITGLEDGEVRFRVRDTRNPKVGA